MTFHDILKHICHKKSNVIGDVICLFLLILYTSIFRAFRLSIYAMEKHQYNLDSVMLELILRYIYIMIYANVYTYLCFICSQ